MATTITSTVGIVSNPDTRPTDGAATLTDPSRWTDPNRRNVTYSVSGRTAYVSPRSGDPYSKAGGE